MFVKVRMTFCYHQALIKYHGKLKDGWGSSIILCNTQKYTKKCIVPNFVKVKENTKIYSEFLLNLVAKVNKDKFGRKLVLFFPFN